MKAERSHLMEKLGVGSSAELGRLAEKLLQMRCNTDSRATLCSPSATGMRSLPHRTDEGQGSFGVQHPQSLSRNAGDEGAEWRHSRRHLSPEGTLAMRTTADVSVTSPANDAAVKAGSPISRAAPILKGHASGTAQSRRITAPS